MCASVAIAGCFLTEPTRVQEDFGTSVRQMVAEQIYDPTTAHNPEALGPTTLGGNAAGASIDGYQKASEQARRERTRTVGSPIPAVGTTSE